MNKNWVAVGVAAVFEVAWVFGLKHADRLLEWGGTGIAMFISFYLMIKAARFLPVGTVYAVFVGLGTAGTVAVEMLLAETEVSWLRLVFMGLLLGGVIGLKMLGNKKEEASGI